MRSISLISDSPTPCGVESFARVLARELAARDGVSQHETMVLGGTQRIWDSAWDRAFALRLEEADTLIVNLPVVAWKRQLAGPVRAMRAALRRGREVLVVLHEWADLDWKRRLSYLPVLACATRLLFSSPLVRAQFEADVLSRFSTARRGLVPIPPNLRRPTTATVTAVSEQLLAMMTVGCFVLGHFGAIYPKKQSIEVLDIAAALKANGRRVHAVFIGSFIGGGSVDPRAPFEARVRALGLERDVTITGYIGPSAEVFAAIEACHALVYMLPDGLTSRRGSVLAGLQTATPVVVNGPRHNGEFDHHPAFRKALGSGQLVLVDPDADAATFARALEGLGVGTARVPAVTFEQAWADVVEAVDGGGERVLKASIRTVIRPASAA